MNKEVPYSYLLKNEPSWDALKDGSKAMMMCECGMIGSLEKHDIGEDGYVNQPVVCNNAECNFHEFIRLVGWGKDNKVEYV